jgi:hypothetical protein
VATSERSKRYRATHLEASRKATRDYMKRTYYSDPEKRRARLDAARRWTLEHAASVKEYRRRYKLLKKYGLTPEDYDTMLKQQQGVCALCKTAPENKNLAVDHDHRTGHVRGLLCDPCNRSLHGVDERFNLLDLYFYLTRRPGRRV